MEDICNNVYNFQFVINFKSHNKPINTKKLLALIDTNSIQGLLMWPTKNVAEWEKTNDRYTSHISSLSFQDTWSTYIPQQYKIFLHYSTYMGFAKICNYISAQCTNDLEHNVS